LFVGSCVVESGCKAVIGQRLKLSDMRWTVAGADAIAARRCQQASRPEDRIRQERRNQTVIKKPKSLIDKIAKAEANPPQMTLSRTADDLIRPEPQLAGSSWRDQ
jgi:hypothetical protein